MTTPTYVTSNEAQISVSVTGITMPNWIKSWKSYQGGDATASTSILQPGAGIKGVAMPGPVTRSNVVVGIPYTADLHALRNTLDAAVNSAMTAAYVPTDPDGNPDGDQKVTRNGLLSKVEVGAFDAQNGNAVIMQLTMECNT